ncbi:NUDIX domain-containing protein [Georgenia sp. TF02-10]|uniref:NUDIX domain-containing protein n=1 Tax=Georgenia sp. TF02-10 TaxID=2917725 RepID=UPI001FA6C752|nr:NUDIX domain-containing protein [Georgenia sp. TF02-10]UNX55716.1 NUDIX domain-containing protein [Georgenia sp. TF02-10]
MSVSRPEVVACVLVRHGRLLLCHRRDDAPWYPGVWDLVGGHVRSGESAVEALRRECREELGIDVSAVGQRWRVVIDRADLTVLRVERWRGEARNTALDEHQAIGWFTLDEIARLPLADPRLSSLAAEVLPGGG